MIKKVLLSALMFITFQSFSQDSLRLIEVSVPPFIRETGQLDFNYECSEIYYHDEDDLFDQIEKLLTDTYGSDNINVRIVYRRYFDKDNLERMEVSRVNIFTNKKYRIKVVIRK